MDPSADITGISDIGNYASANIQDAEETRPTAAHLESLGGNGSIEGITRQSLNRHITESIPQPSPPLQNNWRKRLREMMIKQNETVLGFLYKPATEHFIVGPVEQALRRYAVRQDIDVNALRSFKSLLDISGSVSEEIEQCIAKKGTSNALQVRGQMHALIELYKDTGDKLLECENQLKLRLDKMDSVQRRVSTVIELQTNDATPDLVVSLEQYLKVSFRDMSIEPIYKNLLYLYQKHITLREAIQIFKTGSQSEPLCPICITESVGMAITPCGHTFCQTCARRMVNECGVCRGRIKERMKLYFS